jgi:hypothetical protein
MGRKPVPSTKVKIDEHLAALDTGLVMMRTQARSRNQMLAAYNAEANRIQADAGPYRDYVAARLLAIGLANGLGADPNHGDR